MSDWQAVCHDGAAVAWSVRDFSVLERAGPAPSARLRQGPVRPPAGAESDPCAGPGTHGVPTRRGECLSWRTTACPCSASRAHAARRTRHERHVAGREAFTQLRQLLPSGTGERPPAKLAARRRTTPSIIDGRRLQSGPLRQWARDARQQRRFWRASPAHKQPRRRSGLPLIEDDDLPDESI